MSYGDERIASGRAIDVGIITIVPTEVEALFAALDISKDSYEPAESPLQYWRTLYDSISSGRAVSIVVSILGAEAGNTEISSRLGTPQTIG